MGRRSRTRARRPPRAKAACSSARRRAASASATVSRRAPPLELPPPRAPTKSPPRERDAHQAHARLGTRAGRRSARRRTRTLGSRRPLTPRSFICEARGVSARADASLMRLRRAGPRPRLGREKLQRADPDRRPHRGRGGGLLGAPSLALRASQLVQLRCAVYFVRGGRRGVRPLKPREHARRCRARVVVRQLGVFSPSRNSAERFVPKILGFFPRRERCGLRPMPTSARTAERTPISGTVTCAFPLLEPRAALGASSPKARASPPGRGPRLRSTAGGTAGRDQRFRDVRLRDLGRCPSSADALRRPTTRFNVDDCAGSTSARNTVFFFGYRARGILDGRIRRAGSRRRARRVANAPLAMDGGVFREERTSPGKSPRGSRGRGSSADRVDRVDPKRRRRD